MSHDHESRIKSLEAAIAKQVAGAVSVVDYGASAPMSHREADAATEIAKLRQTINDRDAEIERLRATIASLQAAGSVVYDAKAWAAAETIRDRDAEIAWLRSYEAAGERAAIVVYCRAEGGVGEMLADAIERLEHHKVPKRYAKR